MQWWPLSIAFVAVAVLVGYGAKSSGWFVPRSAPTTEGAKVQRGPLHISILARGNLKAADSVSLKSEVEGRTLILSLVPEGTHVKEGDIVCELDATALVERRFQQTIAVSNAEAAYIKAKQNFEIQESQNKSDNARAGQKQEFAEQDVRKYDEGERASEREKLVQAIELATEDASRAADKLAWSEKLAEKGFLTASELAADRAANHRSKVLFEQATRDLDLLDRFTAKRKADELRAALEEAQRERERVELQAKARIVDFAADVRTSEAKFNLEQQKLAQVGTQIEKARLRAPRAGMLVYTQRDSDEPPIHEGAEVREREEILTIPNEGGMVVQAKLHETVIKQVEIGRPCIVKVEALPGQVFEGKVSFISMLPDQSMRWSNPNTRVYATDIHVAAPSDDMRPGMSCSVEILIEDLPDTLQVPVQSVFRDGQDNVSFVATAKGIERRTVRIGRYNELWVQILAGLSEGETVLLSAPPGLDRLATPADSEGDNAKPVVPKSNQASAPKTKPDSN